MAEPAIPTTMKAAVIEELGKVVIKEVPVPVPEDGQILVKIEATPINPSDQLFIDGNKRCSSTSTSFS